MPSLSDLEKNVLSELLKKERQYASQIQDQLGDTLKNIYGEMKKIYDKYSKNGVLTKVEMTKYNKYVTMEKQILAKLDPAIKENIKTIKHLLPDMYDESFFHSAWAMDNATGLRLSYGNVNTKAMLATFEITNPKNIELVEALKNYGPNAKKSIRSAMLNGLSQGKSYNKMAADLKKSMGKIYSSAMTIARTEGQRAQNKGQDDAYMRARENGVEGIQVWSSTLDQRTRPDHGAMDGVSKQKDGLYHLPNGEQAMYPCDPNLSAEQSINCRCRERFEIEGFSPQLMRTRAEGVLPYQTYPEYVDEYHPDWKKKGAR
jgi:SPP1 gp7 family putative phage head morphogenesis protein